MAKELYKLTISGTHTTEYWQNDIYFEGDNITPNDPFLNADDLLGSWEASPLGAYQDLLPASVQIMRLQAQRIELGRQPVMTRQYQIAEAVGTVSGGAAAQQLCPIVRLIPPMGTKSAGKFFLPCIPESDINGNIVQAGWITRLQAYMDLILSNFGVNSIIWLAAVYSTKLNPYVDAVTYDTSPTVGFQRRRDRPR